MAAAERHFERALRMARAVSKHRWLAFAVVAGSTLLAATAIQNVPDRYEASARVYVDTQRVLKPLMSGLTFQPDIDQQVRMLARTLISRPNLEHLASIPGLGFDVSTPEAREMSVSRLMDRIKVVPTASENLYQISYRGASPGIAVGLVQATLDMFVHAGVESKRRDSREAGEFIEQQIRTYEGQLIEAENRLKEFKSRHFGITGVSGQDYFARISALSDDVNRLRLELNAATQSRLAFRQELAREDPQLPSSGFGAEANAPLRESEARLDAQRKQLDELLRRYTDAHPDVISARRAVDELASEVRQRRQADAEARAGNASRAPTSPVYQKLRLSLADAEAQVASLRSQLASKQEQLAQVQAQAGRMPQVEAELAQLNRDYDVLRKSYDQMVARRESALLGARLDEASQLAEFRIVEPPRVSPKPVFPSRVHLALLVIALALMLGAAAAIGAERWRPSFDDALTLGRDTGRPVVGVLSRVETAHALRDSRRRRGRFALACSALFTLQAAWVATVAWPSAAIF